MTTPSDDHRRLGEDYRYEDYPVSSQPPFPPQQAAHSENHRHRQSHAIPILLPLFLLVFFLVGFFSIYLLHYLSTLWIARRQRNLASSPDQPPHLHNHGLDPSVIASFPIFPYGVVRGLNKGGPGLECAICISELRHGVIVRLLTVCSHVFHAECIDEWLLKHTTCPVCRSDLKEPPDAVAVLAVEQAAAAGIREERRDSYAVYIGEENEEQSGRSSSGRNPRRQWISTGRRGRWQSTGGHMVDDGRYTLRLTDVEEQRIARYHTRAKSR